MTRASRPTGTPQPAPTGRRRLAAALSGLAAAGLLVAGPAGAGRAQDRLVVIGTAPVSGVYFPAGGAICQLVNRLRESSGLRCVVEATDGSAENLDRLKSDDLEFAMLQSDWQYHAYQGSGAGVSDQPFTELRSVFSMQAQTLTIVTARESGIVELKDLEGKRVNLGPGGSAVQAASELLIESLGWHGDTFAEVLELGVEEQVDALCAGLIDAFVLPTTHPNGIVAAATEGCLARLVTVNGAAVDKLLVDWPFYALSSIPGGLYRGNPETVKSFGLRATLVTTTATPAETVYVVVKAVFEQLDELRQQHPAFAGLALKDMIAAGLSAPLHDGALLYYKEAGWR